MPAVYMMLAADAPWPACEHSNAVSGMWLNASQGQQVIRRRGPHRGVGMGKDLSELDGIGHGDGDI